MFPTILTPSTVDRIRSKLRTGMYVWRGKSERPADPGDLGQGTYHSTSKARARCYGPVYRKRIELKNPLILDVEAAYTYIGDYYGTISGIPGDPSGGSGDMKARERCSEKASRELVGMGYDAVVSVNKNEMEIVILPRYE